MRQASSMRVCMVVHNDYDSDARVQRYVQALVTAGAEVHVLCPREPGHPPGSRSDGVRVFTIRSRHRQHSQPSRYLWEYGLALILYFTRLISLYVQNRYQVIHTHNMPDFLVLASLLPRLLGARLILDIHDPMPEFYMSKHKGQAGGSVVRILRLQERICAALAHAVITANPSFKRALIRRGIAPDKITVINNIPDTNLFRRDRYQAEHGAAREAFTLICPGTIAPRYGLDLPIRALPALSRRIPNIRLHIIGKQTQYAAELAHLAKELNVGSFLQMTPGVPLELIPGLMAVSDVGIYAGLSDPHMDVAVPGKVLEYAMMGLPIVSSRLKVVEEGFPPSAILLFEPGNVEQFTQCVIDLYENPALRAKLVDNMDQGYVHKHSWHAELKKYIDLVNQLVPAEAPVTLR